MRCIQKSNQEPDPLLIYRKSTGKDAYWDGFAEKNALRDQLLKDQGELCCYCMRRINISNMKVEHYLSRSRHPKHELSWSNLLAACTGNEGQPKTLQTCDTAKGDADIRIDPRRPDHVDSLRFLSDGRIETTAFTTDVDETLNLNCQRLTELRAYALDGFIAAMQKKHGREGAWPTSKMKKELERLAAESPLREFCGMFEWWLKKKLGFIHTKTAIF